MTGSFTYDVFLSYNLEDKPRVRQLADRLKEAGLRVWFDEWIIKPGDNIYLAIEHGLEASRVQVLCLSPAALGSEWVKLERSTVLFRDPTNISRRFVPLLLADCMLPDTIRCYKYLDFRQETSKAFDDLLAACRKETEALAPVAKKETKREPESGSDDDTVKRKDLEKEERRAPTSIGRDGDTTASGNPDVYIDDIKYSTIQEAVNAGNPGKTINLVAGTYQENLRIDKSFTIKGVGAGKTIIDGSQTGPVIFVGKNRANIDVTLTGITIKGGTGTEVKAADNDPNTHVCGGGIINYGRITITDCIISDNEAYYGGGIFNKGILNLNRGASVTHNAAYNGGGIYGNIGSININGGNVASNKAEQLGGGIYTGYRGAINVLSGTISNNAAKNSGGGIYSQGGAVTLNEGAIFSNDAFSSGGGINCSGGSANHLKGGSIHDNASRNGAGAVNGGGKMILDGTRIHSNIADRNGNGLGGGIMNSGIVTLNNGSIDHNHASKDGGGIFNTDNGKVTGNLALVHDNTLGSDSIPDEIAPLDPGP